MLYRVVFSDFPFILRVGKLQLLKLQKLAQIPVSSTFNRSSKYLSGNLLPVLSTLHNMAHTALVVLSLFLLAFIGGSSAAECNATSISTNSNNTCPCPDVFLDVPNLSVNQIYLEVDSLEAHVSLNAKVANLVQLTAGM